MEIKNATEVLPEYALDVANEPLVVTIGGKLVAAVVVIPNADLKSISLSAKPEFLSVIAHYRASLRSDGAITGQEIQARLQ